MRTHFGAIWESVADAVGDQAAIVQGERRVSWRDYEQRAARLTTALLDAGVVPGSKVGMYLYNSPEYAETNFAAIKCRAVPINVNYRYLGDELRYLLDDADIEVLVFHSSLGDRVRAVRDRAPGLRLLIEVDDGPAADGTAHVDGAIGYDELQATTAPAARIEPQGDELYIFYTGGTTGMPKGVMYPLEDFTGFFLDGYPAMIGVDPFGTAEDLAPTARRLLDEGRPLVAMSGPPLMHGTGCWLGLMAPHAVGATAVLAAGRSLDAVETWDTVEREGVQHLVVVGDAFARPLLRALDTDPGRWDLDSLRLMISSGAMFSMDVKQGLIKHLPNLAIADVLGSTEGGMGQSITTAETMAETAKFALSATAKVFTDDGREVTPGSGEVGMVANGGLTPIGYYKDPEKSARTFREVDGVRYSFPGDMAMVEADGTLTLLGRGSNCINTGGEKVFPEEVEEALKGHPAVDDALVVGVPDERFGSRVVAIASLSPGAVAEPAEIVADARTRLASYKLPRELRLVDHVPRAPNGKADYPAARAVFD
ncbi:MAG: AMP-binding protein [Actinomycetota bacterium]|nr:AMP-binding protein [Actinomycetota bacterium]